MRHLNRTAATVVLGVIAVALLVSEAAAQGQLPATVNWHELTDVVPRGATVVVKTRDGSATKGRLRSLSDTAIVLDGGRVTTIPAAAVVAIEGGRQGRPVKRGAAIGFQVGLLLATLCSAAAAEQAFSSEPCAPDECITWSDALFGVFFFPAAGAGIGAGIGAVVPGKRTLVYSAGASESPALVPIAGNGRRGAAVRVAF